MRLARADVFADEMRLGDGHVKFRRLIAGLAGRVFDDETFGFGLRLRIAGSNARLSPAGIFQAEITPDAVLQMHDQIAFLQIGEINVQRGTRGQRVRRFEPARALDFVAPKNFRIGDDDQFRLVANKAAGERAELHLRSGV